MHYFCGNTEIATDLQEREPQRAAMYRATASLVRAYANIADELEATGYSGTDIARIRQQLGHYLKLREIIRKASGESLDLKAYEADMRHLINTYIQADEPRKISPFDDMSLLELIVKTGIAETIAQRLGALQGNKNAVAEAIENNVRSTIIKEHLHDPAYYEKMSALLDEIIAARKAKAIEYEDYLKRIAALAEQVEAGQANDTPEVLKQSPALRALYNNLKQHDEQSEGLRGVAEEGGEYIVRGDPGLHLALQIDATGAHLPHHQSAEGILMVTQIAFGAITVDVVFKDIKNIHLSVYPPSGRVRIAAPSRMSLDTIRVFAISRLGWIKQQRQKLQEQERETPREYLGRESHYVWGKRYLLSVIEGHDAPSVALEHSRLLLRVRPDTDAQKKRAIVEAWYRWQLKQAVPLLIAQWEPLMGVKVERFFVQRMKTKWGSCNHRARTLRLNTELAKKPRECLEYIVVHAMTHILEPTHNARFVAMMDQFMPQWQFYRE